MNNTQIIQTTIEIIVIAVLLVGYFYQPILAKWEAKQKEKVLKAFKNRKKYRGDI